MFIRVHERKKRERKKKEGKATVGESASGSASDVRLFHVILCIFICIVRLAAEKTEECKMKPPMSRQSNVSFIIKHNVTNDDTGVAHGMRHTASFPKKFPILPRLYEYLITDISSTYLSNESHQKIRWRLSNLD